MEGTYLNGKWKLEARLGAGGVATVYRATHRNGTRAAIKILAEDRSEDEDVRRRFLREGYVANSVAHAGTVRVLDDDVTSDGRVFLVMELLEGEAIDERCRRLGGSLSIAEGITIADAVLDVLAAAHEKGIVHRDIKPANIFLTKAGEVKVLDFGLAKMKSTLQGDATAVGALLGTPGYMAPEVARAARDDDARADVWSVGATMFKLLTGEHPYEGTDMLALLVATMRERPRPIGRVAASIPPAIGDVVDRALAVNPEHRWPSARAMQSALRAAREAPERRRVFPSFADVADEHDVTVLSDSNMEIDDDDDGDSDPTTVSERALRPAPTGAIDSTEIMRIPVRPPLPPPPGFGVPLAPPAVAEHVIHRAPPPLVPAPRRSRLRAPVIAAGLGVLAGIIFLIVLGVAGVR